MLTVHHLGASQSERIVWLCEELGLDYELRRYERDPATRLAPPEYKALTPFGSAPTITDGEVTLGETNAIVEYLLARYGAGRLALAPDHPDYAAYLYWLHFSNGSFMPARLVDIALQMAGAPDGPAAQRLRSRAGLALRISEQRLAEAPFFAGGAFTAADVLMVLPLRGGRDRALYPRIDDYLDRMTARPAYQRAMAKAEPGAPPP
jgi:glutathione S-transferase